MKLSKNTLYHKNHRKSASVFLSIFFSENYSIDLYLNISEGNVTFLPRVAGEKWAECLMKDQSTCLSSRRAGFSSLTGHYACTTGRLCCCFILLLSVLPRCTLLYRQGQTHSLCYFFIWSKPKLVIDEQPENNSRSAGGKAAQQSETGKLPELRAESWMLLQCGLEMQGDSCGWKPKTPSKVLTTIQYVWTLPSLLDKRGILPS